MNRTNFAASLQPSTAMTSIPLSRASLPTRSSKGSRLAKAAALALLLGAASDIALAQSGFPPSLMSYQGFLVDANGAALAPSNPVNFSVVFRIYGAPTGGSSLWTEAQTVTIDKGNFSVVLGEGGNEGTEPRPDLSTVFTSNRASDLYLGITVKGVSNSEILPRLRLLTSPYSFLARTANALSGSDGGSLIRSDAGRLIVSQPIQSTGSGGNPRGTFAVDLQTQRSSTAPGQVASGWASVIVGGQFNTASQGGAVVVGGDGNVSSGWWSFIGSGQGNTASGNMSAIPGGMFNNASGSFSFAAGRRAKANHDGSMVFSDSQDADIASTGNNQFLVRASGGVAINTTPASGAALTVSGQVRATSASFDSMNVGALATTSVSGFGTVPLGGIIMWSGSMDAVPSGWALCNGQSSNGRQTPDLRGRFVIGAGQGNGLSNRNVNATGGAETHTLSVNQMPSHNHNVSGTTTENGSHTHTYNDYYFSECCPSWGWWGSGDSDGDNQPRGVDRTTAAAGSHTHTFNVTSGTTGGSQAVDHMPPFYALAFIMRVQ